MSKPTEPRTTTLYHATGAPPARATGAGALEPPEVAAALAAGLAAFVLAGAGARALGAPVLAAIAVAQAGLAAPALVVAARRRRLASLGLTRPSAAELIAALLVGASAWYLNLRLLEALRGAAPRGSAALAEAVVSHGPTATLLALAVATPLAEELVFRGALARTLAARRGPWVATLGSAGAFAAYHLSAAQLVPTFTLGLGLAVLARRGVWPAVACHAVNNAAAACLARGALPGVAEVVTRHPSAALAAAAAAATAGLALSWRAGLARRPRARDGRDTSAAR